MFYQPTAGGELQRIDQQRDAALDMRWEENRAQTALRSRLDSPARIVPSADFALRQRAARRAHGVPREATRPSWGPIGWYEGGVRVRASLAERIIRPPEGSARATVPLRAWQPRDPFPAPRPAFSLSITLPSPHACADPASPSQQRADEHGRGHRRLRTGLRAAAAGALRRGAGDRPRRGLDAAAGGALGLGIESHGAGVVELDDRRAAGQVPARGDADDAVGTVGVRGDGGLAGGHRRVEDDVQELAARRAVLERGAGLARPHDDGVAHAAEPDAAPALAADRRGAERAAVAGRADHVDRARLGPGELDAVIGHREARG